MFLILKMQGSLKKQIKKKPYNYNIQKNNHYWCYDILLSCFTFLPPCMCAGVPIFLPT